jgi:hypothetical protein
VKTKPDFLALFIKKEKAYLATLPPGTRKKVKLLWRAASNALRKTSETRNPKAKR